MRKNLKSRRVRTIAARSAAAVELLEGRLFFSTTELFQYTSSTTIGIWINTNHQGTGNPTANISSTTGYASTLPSGGSAITINEADGQAIPTDGLTLNGASGSSNTLTVTGDGSNDSVNIASGFLSFQSTEVALSNITGITIQGGTGGLGTTVAEFSAQAIPSGGIDIVGNSSATNTTVLDGTTGTETVNASSSSISFGTGVITYSNMSKFYFDPNGGTVAMNVNSGEFILPAESTGSIADRNFSSLNISSGAELYVEPPSTHADRQVLIFPHAALTDAGTLDLTENDLVETNGAWSGWNSYVSTGAIKTSSTDDNLYALGVTPNNGGSGSTALYTTFDGVSITYTAVLVKWTWAGDSNDDGLVNATDTALINNGYANGLTGWYNGDYNYNGVVDGSDYALADNAVNNGAGTEQL